MRELQRKQKIRRATYSFPSLIILFIVTFLLVKGAIGVIGKGIESSKRSKNLEEKAQALAVREQELEAGIARLQTEEGIKDEIKERFSVTQEGEFVAVLVDDRSRASSTDGDALPWYKRFWIAIIGSK